MLSVPGFWKQPTNSPTYGITRLDLSSSTPHPTGTQTVGNDFWQVSVTLYHVKKTVLVFTCQRVNVYVQDRQAKDLNATTYAGN